MQSAAFAAKTLLVCLSASLSVCGPPVIPIVFKTDFYMPEERTKHIHFRFCGDRYK